MGERVGLVGIGLMGSAFAHHLRSARFEVRGFEPKLPDHHFLWEHRNRVLLGGVALFQGLHAWTADTPEPGQRGAWIDLLDAMEARG